ncbi:MAG TPA: bacillithiol system redox-active protein YtxJ [Bacillus bacterium]|nr:bacillithiol system redox-active protein YtxJ [Bacillus sp. (in: firmicutes)]
MKRQQLISVDAFNDVLTSNEKFLLIKHSLTCPISGTAFEEYEKFVAQSDFPTFYLYVQEARPLSNYIAETFAVKHESPQAIIFEGGKVIWYASHWDITESSLKQAIEK